MKNNTKISVVIPAFNTWDTLQQTLESLCLQTDFPDEVIVVDDGSETPVETKLNKCSDIREKFLGRNIELVVLRNQESVGPAETRNRGAKEARSKIILFIDADVILQPQGIQKILSTFENQNDISAIQGIYTSCQPENASVFSRYQNHYYHNAFMQINDDYPAVCATYCFAILRDVFLETGGFDSSIRCPTVEDEAYGYLLNRLNKIIYLQRDLQVTHLADYDFSTLILRKFRMSFNQIKSLLRGNQLPLGGTTGTNKTHHSKTTLAAVIVSPFVLFSWLSSWPFLGFVLLLYTALNAQFWSYLLKKEAPVYFLEMIGLTICDQVTILTGMFIGSLDYISGRHV